MKIISPKKPSDMYGKAVIFGIFFIIVLIFFIIASKNVKSVETGSKILNGVTRYKGFSEKEKEALKLRNAGFWQFVSDTSSSISVSDRIELKTNGIFWRVTIYAIALPSGNSTRLMHVSTGYLNPFCILSVSNKDSMICDVRIIKQTFLLGKDTCYAPSNIDTTWYLSANGKRFDFDNRVYTAYDTSGPALLQFFPAGALDIIDKSRDRRAYQVGNKTVFLAKSEAKRPKSMETFDLCQCEPSISLESLSLKAVASDMSTIKVDTLTKDAVQKTIDAYYRIFIETIMKKASHSFPGEPGNTKVVFDITPDGKVSNTAVVKLSVQDKKIEQAILSNITAWRFPEWKSGGASLHIEREFWF